MRRPPGTLPFLAEVAAFHLLFVQLHRLAGGAGSPIAPVVDGLSALFLPLTVRALSGETAVPGGASRAVRRAASRLRAALASIGLRAPDGGRVDLALALWAAFVLGGTALLLMVAAGAIAPAATGAALDRWIDFRFGAPPRHGSIVRHLITPAVLVPAGVEVIVVRGYVQGLAMRRFGTAGACAPWLAAALGRATTGYLLGLEASACLAWGLGSLLPGPILEALYRRSNSVLPLFLARVATDLLVFGVAFRLLIAPPATARAAALAVALLVCVMALGLGWLLRRPVRDLWGGTIRIAREGVVAGVPLAAGLVAAQTLAIVVAGPGLAVLLATCGLVVARLASGFSRVGTS